MEMILYNGKITDKSKQSDWNITYITMYIFLVQRQANLWCVKEIAGLKLFSTVGRQMRSAEIIKPDNIVEAVIKRLPSS